MFLSFKEITEACLIITTNPDIMVKSTSIVLSLAVPALAAPICTWSSWKAVKNMFILYAVCRNTLDM